MVSSNYSFGGFKYGNLWFFSWLITWIQWLNFTLFIWDWKIFYWWVRTIFGIGFGIPIGSRFVSYVVGEF